jgi:hypothetical protein
MTIVRAVRNVAFVLMLVAYVEGTPIAAAPHENDPVCGPIGLTWTDWDINFCGQSQESRDAICTALCQNDCLWTGNGYEASCTNAVPGETQGHVTCGCTMADGGRR